MFLKKEENINEINDVGSNFCINNLFIYKQLMYVNYLL